ncbi:Glycine--tRNA ligase [Planctomycetes bacterium Pan216]|uniref:Glycine--tRNA ligase n=1 Tax=Kolteria novifilia TaxID=2527975 RepID=A0A518B5R9_9BACT|nr:Glycine--tRNA ligase [Planctomycetes bacterium Pan216]
MDLMEKLVSLCKRRGFIFPSSEIYGGLNGCWDYGPLGVELKRNIKNVWWHDMVVGHDDLAVLPGAPSPYSMVGLDCSILMNPRVWEASGHVGGFSDPMIDCTESKKRYRADQLVVLALDVKEGPMVAFAEGDDEAQKGAEKRLAKLLKTKAPLEGLQIVPLLDVGKENFEKVVGPDVAKPGTLTEPRAFNLMFKTHVGALEDSSSVAYLRPETAQGIFVNFKNVCDTARVRIPFGIAQIGKSFRNEINPRNFTFRSREFEQMEIEFFCTAENADQWYEHWRERRYKWYVDLGLKSERLILREHCADELAHYASGCADVEYEFPFGVSELEGIANRTDFDLKQHMEYSGRDLQFFDDQIADKEKRRFVPYVIEPSAGADRATLAFLCEAYTEDEIGGEKRTVMKFHPKLAPIKVAVLPLVKKDGMPEKAAEIYRRLRKRWSVFFDDKGAIGRRYRRQDEAGTPFCVTIDGQTLDDGTVTLRDRDSTEQTRVAVDELEAQVAERINA